ncbi:MAG: DEAD/DEAH box helicase [Bacteroidetes bacterium]|nr:DEAD/DEAH box helicase [Bacteroidota bacterium]
MHTVPFEQLGLIEPILKALQQEGYTHPTPIQAQSIPYLLEGRDLLGCAQTGTGKTAAFAIPLLQRMITNAPQQPGGRRPIRALVLTPTRELAIQIDESFRAYGRHTGLRYTVIFGGVGQKPQTDALRSGVDVLVATPGRLLDLMGQGYVHLKDLEYFVLDEADRMLDMGFVHDVKRVIAALPHRRQSLFFSATMPPEIQRLAATILTEPVKVEVTPVSSTAETVQQQVYFVEKPDKGALLTHLIKERDIQQVLVFTRTKHGADKLARLLTKAGIHSEAIHGNKAQNARQRALSNFKDHRTRVLVATDIAARGIDIDLLGHVVNYDIPNIPETYVHRIGRTGRAGANGTALSLCDREEVEFLRDIQKLIKRDVPVVEDHPFVLAGGTPVVDPGRRQQQQRGRDQQRGQQPRREQQHQGRNGQRGERRSNGDQPRSQRSEPPQPRPGQPEQAPSGTKDYAALTRELIADVDAFLSGDDRKTGPQAQQPQQQGRPQGQRNRRRWRGRRGGGSGQR